MAVGADRARRGIAGLRLRALLLGVMLLALCLPLPLTLFLRIPLVAEAMRGGDAAPLTTAAADTGLPPLRVTSWWRREFQPAFEQWFADHVAPRVPVIRLTNQLYYSVFDRSYMYNRNIVIGRASTLFEFTYLMRYCASAATDAELLAFAARFGELADRLRSIGQSAVIALITPNKAEVMDEFLPAGLCKRQPGAAEAPMRFAAMLREAGVPVIDGVSLARSAKASDPVPPFPRGGTHWSRLLSLRATGQLLEELDRSFGRDLGSLALGPVRWDAEPTGTDRDLAGLLNLLQAPLDYAVGSASPVCRPTPAGRAMEVVGIGGSFLSAVLTDLADCGLFRSVEQYSYYSKGWWNFPVTERQRVDRASLDWRARLTSPVVLVLEMNSSRLNGRLEWMTEFLDDALAALD